MLSFSFVSKYVGFLNVMMIFVIIGIGADDVFVLLDAFKQSAYEEYEHSFSGLRICLLTPHSGGGVN